MFWAAYEKPNERGQENGKKRKEKKRLVGKIPKEKKSFKTILQSFFAPFLDPHGLSLSYPAGFDIQSVFWGRMKKRK